MAYNCTVTVGVRMNYTDATTDPETRKLNYFTPTDIDLTLDADTATIDIEGNALADIISSM
jgi:CBS-domain-containing membrane protein